MGKPAKQILSFVLPAIAGILFLAVWYGVRAMMSADQRFLLPSPVEVLTAFGEHRSVLLHASLNTLEGALIGFSAAIVISLLLALVLSLSPLVRASLYPYLMLLQMTPVIVLAPIILQWARPGLPSVSVITFLICFFPLVVNTTQGLISTDRNLVDLFRLYGANKRQEICLLRLPAALPYFFTGLRIAATLGPIGAIMGDFTAGSSAGDGGGLGFQAIIFSSQLKMAALFATALVGCLLGFIFVAGVVFLGWWALHRWHDSYRVTDS
ncbi:MAG: ABC transporter permease subunit [Opitutaceae bacterium]|nr:ABC transporter permease subunit [Opitutaceae bacterium]